MLIDTDGLKESVEVYKKAFERALEQRFQKKVSQVDFKLKLDQGVLEVDLKYVLEGKSLTRRTTLQIELGELLKLEDDQIRDVLCEQILNW